MFFHHIDFHWESPFFCWKYTNYSLALFCRGIYFSKVVISFRISIVNFKGNYPETFTVQSALISNKAKSKKIIKNSKKWKILLGKTKLKPHKKHSFKSKTFKKNKVNYLRINIFPDGGISRIRAFGQVTKWK